MSPFVPGLHLCRLFYLEAVRPLLLREYPGLRHAAARLGPGSEVLGFDTDRSVDHDWGPRLELFLTVGDVDRHGRDVSAMLAERLPWRFHGWPTSFEPPDAPVRIMADTDGPVHHRVVITDAAAWSVGLLGFDPGRDMSTQDWLTVPTQRLAEVTGGAVFHDDLGAVGALRARLRWYPDDVWRHVLAAQWVRIGAEEPFVGRTAEAGDELGSRLLAARLAREVMRLCLLLARRYPPYNKWLGTAFAALPGTGVIAAALHEAVDTRDPTARQAALCTALEAAGHWQNRLGLAPPVEATRRPFFDRPYPVIDGGRFAAALRGCIADPTLASAPQVGAVDQVVDAVAVLSDPALARSALIALHRYRQQT